jgi:hypothetical protein
VMCLKEPPSDSNLINVCAIGINRAASANKSIASTEMARSNSCRDSKVSTDVQTKLRE